MIMRIKDYFTNKRLDRLQGDLKMLNNRTQFNPRYALSDLDSDNSLDYTQKIEEYRVWSMGNGVYLRRLYKEHNICGTLNYFWRNCPSTSMMKHSGIPSLIAQKMGTILFGNGIFIDCQAFDENGNENEVQSAKVKEFLNTLYDKLDCQTKFQQGATAESWGGHIFYKFSVDTDLTPFPILEVADITQARVIKKRGLTQAIVFPQYFKENNQQYRLDEVYSTDANGDATIEYRLFRLAVDREIETPLTATARTRELADKSLVVFKGLKGMLAFDKPNKLPSLLFPYGDYGASDFEGALDSFDAMDEAYTDIIKELRTNRTIRYIPESMIPRANGELLLNDDFTDAYVKIQDDIDQNNKSEISFSIIPDKTEAHKAKYLTALTTALNKAGISPYAIGLTGLESVNASAESQQERNKVTLETRKAKLSRWETFIQEILIKAVELNDWILTNTNAVQPYGKMGVDWDNLTLRVSFGDYVVETDDRKITNMATAKSASIISTEEAVRTLHPDWDDTQVLEEVNRIRYEQGMSVDTPLALPELTGIETEDENA